MDRVRVVYDCNVLFQALISTKGPAHRCKQLADEGRIELFVSDYVFAELRDIAGRPFLRDKFRLDSAKVEAFLADIAQHAVNVASVPELYTHPVDAKDSHYVNLALASRAKLLVTRDNDLLRLMDTATPDGRDFRQRLPALEIVEPQILLRELEATRSPPD